MRSTAAILSGLLVTSVALVLVAEPAEAGHRRARFSLHLGFYPGYHYYYYPYGYGAWGHYPVRDHSVGALDLNVKPKRTEVYLDGQYIGLTGDFDGFPSYLWLDRGTYEIVLYKEGYETVSRSFTIVPGAVINVKQRLKPGTGTPPTAPTPAPRAEREIERRPAPRADRPAPRAPRPEREEYDARAEPGQVVLDLAPADASVYLDGRFLGTAAELGGLHAGLIVDPGSHTLEVVRPGFTSERRTFVVEAGAEIEVRLELAPSDRNSG